MNKDIKILSTLFGFVYLILSITLIAVGISDRNAYTGFFKNDCDKPMTRIEVLFPAYQLGCWLGKPL